MLLGLHTKSFFLVIQLSKIELFFRESEDNLKTVVIFDENLFRTKFSQIIINKLKEVYNESGNVKVASKELPIPFSIQWIVPKRDSEGQRVRNIKHFQT